MSDKVQVQPKNELKDLVESYNQNEQEQMQRLARLFRLIKAGKGYRHVKFSNGEQWTNCWGGEDRLDGKLHINRMQQLIKDINSGV